MKKRITAFLSNDSAFGQLMAKIWIIIGSNLMFMIFSLPVITIGPGLVALYHVHLKSMRGHPDLNPVTEFWHGFRNNFRQAIIVWIVFLLVLLVALADIRFLTGQEGIMEYMRYMVYFISGLVLVIVGMLLCVVLIAFLIARQTARRIVKPINELNLDNPLENDAYDELAPLLTRMERQHTQIHQHVKALENARADLAAIMDNMREGMILLDKNSTILSMNESAARIFGVSGRDQIGRNLLSVSRDADLHDLAAAALHGDGGNLTMNRNNRHYHIYASPVMHQDKVRGVVLLVLDVTERFAAEESRREFTANVSHELKTPLTSISGFAEIIHDGIAQPQDVQHFAGMICKESARLIALVNDILELSQLEEKQNLGQKEKVALLTMLRDLTNDFAIPAQKKNLALTLSGDEAEVEGYPTLLREMFFNLIDNAIKYTPDGGEISVSIENTGKQIVCTVSDNGIGIPKEHQPHVFERFYRVDKSHSRVTGGTGLGLAIVKHVAHIHNALVDLASVEGEGTNVQLVWRMQLN